MVFCGYKKDTRKNKIRKTIISLTTYTHHSIYLPKKTIKSQRNQQIHKQPSSFQSLLINIWFFAVKPCFGRGTLYGALALQL